MYSTAIDYYCYVTIDLPVPLPVPVYIRAIDTYTCIHAYTSTAVATDCVCMQDIPYLQLYCS